MNKSIFILCVLSSLLFSADLSRNSNGVVSDSSTSLQWQDNTNIGQKSWNDAITYCNDLILDGNSDWVLPNKNELLSIIGYSKAKPAIKENIFQNIMTSTYWSSTTFTGSTSLARTVNFTYGTTSYSDKTIIVYVRCVRIND